MSTDTTSSNPSPQAVIMDTAFGFFRARTMQVFAELRVADDIAAGRPPQVEQRFLDACAAIGLLRRLPSGDFALTEVGEALRSNTPGSLQAFAASVMGGAHYRAWEKLADTVRTGSCAFEDVFGEDVWSYFTTTNVNEGQLFNRAMAGSSEMIMKSVLDHYEFPPDAVFVDVGGGTAAMLTAILERCPNARGTVFDLPSAAEAARETIARRGMSGRCDFVEGDFFQSVPAGGDFYTMKWILHDWPDPKASAILRTLHNAMGQDAKLLLIETVVAEDDDAMFGRMMDLNMMVMCGGKERTQAQWQQLLDESGFKLTRIIPMPGPASLIEAVKK